MARETLEPGLTTLQRLQKFAEHVGEDGEISVHWTGKEWMFASTFGREAPDSPMAGGAAYGADDEVTNAIEEALKDVRFGPDTPPGGAKAKPWTEVVMLLDEHIRSWHKRRMEETDAGFAGTLLQGETALQLFRQVVIGNTLELPHA